MANPSPTCQVREGAGAWQDTTDGVDVTAGSSLTIRLIDTSPYAWSLECIGTDENNDASAINSTLVLNNSSKTATLTAPGAGAALLFRSTINGGVSSDGTARPSYATTFKVAVRTTNGLRVGALGETVENDHARGATGLINAAIRAVDSLLGGSPTNAAPPATSLSNARVDASTPPTWFTYKTPIGAYKAPTAVTAALHTSLLAPANAASGVILELYWAPTTSGSGNVKFQIDVVYTSVDGVVGSATTLARIVATPAAADKLQKTQFQYLAGVTPNSVIEVRVARVGGGSDTYAGDVVLMHLGLGIGIYNAPAVVSPTYNTIADVTSKATTYTGLTFTRTGSTAYLQTADGVVESQGNNVALWEDRNDGAGGGVWGFASYTNDVTDAFDINNAFWSTVGSPTRTTNVGDGPLVGSGNADSIRDTSAAAAAVVYHSGFTTTPPHRFGSIWLKDGSNPNAPSPQKTGLVHTYPVTNGTSIDARESERLSAGVASWKRLTTRTHGLGTIGNFCIAPSAWSGSASAGYTENVAGTGETIVWGAQTTTAPADVPLISGSASGNMVIGLSTPATLVDSGDFDFEITLVMRQDRWTANGATQNQIPSGYILKATSTDGELSLRYDAGTSPKSYYDDAFILKVRGVDVVSLVGNGSNTELMHGWRNGDKLTLRAWYRVSTGQCGIRLSVNGTCTALTATAGSGTWGKTGSTTGTALAAPSSAYLLSDGSSNFFAAQISGVVKSYVLAAGNPPTFAPEFVWVGDSTSAPYLRTICTVSALIKNSEAASRQGSLSIACASETIQQQITRWSAIVDKSKIAAVVIYVGFNNINGSAESASTVLGRIQTLINTIASDRPTAKIILCQLHPCKTWVATTPKYQVWQDVNSGINGGTGINTTVTPITGAHAIVTSHVATLNNGSDDLAYPNYAIASGDVHPNDWGRIVIANAVRTAMQGLSLLP